mgnify:FL=1
MNKREAYQNLYNLASENNQAFRIRISDKKGRCRTYGGKAMHTKPKADFVKELAQFKNIVNGVRTTQRINIVIPDFVTRPKPVTKPKRVISSKYNKTCQCQIKIYDNPCTYWLSWNNDYWSTKSSQLKQYRQMIDESFEKSEIEIAKENKRLQQNITFNEQVNSGDFNETPITDVNESGGCSGCSGTKSVDPIIEKELQNNNMKFAGIAAAGVIGLLLYTKGVFK